MTKKENRLAVITGGSTLIGEKIIDELLKTNYHVISIDINIPAKEFNKDFFKFIKGDITKDQCINEIISVIEAHGKKLDVLINLACTYLDNGLDSSRSDWLDALNVNVVSGAIIVNKVIPYMSNSIYPSIVNIASIGGKVAQPNRLLYSVSKSAVLHLTKTLSALLSDSNIRVNSVSPGWTWSNVIKDMSNNNRAIADEVGSKFHLANRIGNPEEIAKVVLFLCSENASFINGTDIAVDGGYTALGGEAKIDQVKVLINKSRKL